MNILTILLFVVIVSGVICLIVIKPKEVTEPAVDTESMIYSYAIKSDWGNPKKLPTKIGYVYDANGNLEFTAGQIEAPAPYKGDQVYSAVRNTRYDPTFASRNMFPNTLIVQGDTYNNTIVTSAAIAVTAVSFDPIDYDLISHGAYASCIDPDQICLSRGSKVCLGNQIYSDFPNKCQALDGTIVDGPTVTTSKTGKVLSNQTFEVGFYDCSSKIKICEGRIGQIAFNVPTGGMDYKQRLSKSQCLAFDSEQQNQVIAAPGTWNNLYSVLLDMTITGTTLTSTTGSITCNIVNGQIIGEIPGYSSFRITTNRKFVNGPLVITVSLDSNIFSLTGTVASSVFTCTYSYNGLYKTKKYLQYSNCNLNNSLETIFRFSTATYGSSTKTFKYQQDHSGPFVSIQERSTGLYVVPEYNSVGSRLILSNTLSYCWYRFNGIDGTGKYLIYVPDPTKIPTTVAAYKKSLIFSYKTNIENIFPSRIPIEDDENISFPGGDQPGRRAVPSLQNFIYYDSTQYSPPVTSLTTQQPRSAPSGTTWPNRTYDNDNGKWIHNSSTNASDKVNAILSTYLFIDYINYQLILKDPATYS